MEDHNGFYQQVLSLMSVFFNAFVNSCATNWLPNVLYFVTRPNHLPSITVTQSRNIASLTEVGKLLLTLPGGCLASKFGRKKIWLCVWFLNCISWILVSSSTSVFLIYVARFFSGAADGLSSVTTSIVIGEIASPQYRGIFSSFLAVMANSGTLFVSLVSAAFMSYEVVTYSATSLTILFLPSIYWLRESPYFLASIQEYEKARSNLTILRLGSKEVEIDKEFEILRRAIDSENAMKAEISWFELIRQRSIMKSLLGGVLMSILSTACGWNSIRLFMTVSFPSTDYLSNSMYPLISSTFVFFSSMFSVAIVEKLPRKTFIMLGSFLSFVTLSFGGLSCYMYSNLDLNSETWKWCFLGSSLAYLMVGAVTIGPLVETIRSEIFPYSVKGIGNSICLISRSLSVILCYKLYHMFEETYGLYMNFIFFAVNSVFVAVVVVVMLPETRGKSLVEVQKSFRGEKGENKENC